MSEALPHECGIVGVMSTNGHASMAAFQALRALQHRGEDAAGIGAISDGYVTLKQGMGFVDQVITEADLADLQGGFAVGQDRYRTDGDIDGYAPPVNIDGLLFAHNGSLPDMSALKSYFDQQGLSYSGKIDTQLGAMFVADRRKNGESLPDAIEHLGHLVVGAYAFIAAEGDEMVVARDRFGIRPLELGVLGKEINERSPHFMGYIAASETVAIDKVGTPLRPVKPGEMLIFDSKGRMTSRQGEAGQTHYDFFEDMYLAHPDSIMHGQKVAETRYNLGQALAELYPATAELRRRGLIVPVPASSLHAARGYADATGIAIDESGLVKIKDVRSFLQPGQAERQQAVRSKVKPTRRFDRHIVVDVDDSGVRFNTIGPVNEMLETAGAEEIRTLFASSKISFLDDTGIYIPNQKELGAANFTSEQLRRKIGASFVGFLDIDRMVAATGQHRENFHLGPFDGHYIIPTQANQSQYQPVDASLSAGQWR